MVFDFLEISKLNLQLKIDFEHEVEIAFEIDKEAYDIEFCFRGAAQTSFVWFIVPGWDVPLHFRLIEGQAPAASSCFRADSTVAK